MNALARHNQKLDEKFNYSTLIKLLKTIKKEIETKKESGINKTELDYSEKYREINETVIDPRNFEPDLANENCPGLKLGNELRGRERTREHALEF